MLIKPLKQKDGFTIVELLIVVVVIAILAAITIVAYNGIAQRAKDAAKASELSQWKKKSEIYKTENNIVCDENYVFVYGNATLGTSNFCVMKYEAKNVSGVATSQASGTPWVSINQTTAISTAIAAGGHLVTDAEWMTIAADVLSVKYNWSGGEVGSGIMYQGHVNSNPASALAASTDDKDTLNGMTGGIGTTAGNNSSRVLYLSSGDAIWDFTGNVWESTQRAIGTPTLTASGIGVSGDSGFSWRDYTNGSLAYGGIAASSRPGALNAISALSSLTWNANKGVGQIYANYADSGPRAMPRGGRWTDGVNAGVFAVDMSLGASNSASTLGFRVAK